MKRYEDYKKLDNKSEYLTKEEMASIRWTKYKIVVPTEEDREEIMEALEHFHDVGYDSDFITANGTVVYLGEQTDKIDRFQRGVIKTVGDLV